MPSVARIKRKQDEDMENNAGNCFTSYLQGMYIVFVMFQTAIVKGCNRNSYESVLRGK